MSHQLSRLLFLILSLLFMSTSLHAADKKAMAKKNNVPFPDVGQWVPFEVEKKKLEIVYIPTQEKKKAAVVIIQGRDQKAYEHEIVKYLRRELPEHGFNTYGVNIPHGKNMLDSDYSKLVPKVIEFVKKNGDKNVFIVLYGEGAGDFLSCFTTKPPKSLKGIVLLSSYAKEKKKYDKVVKDIKKWKKLPLFDIRAQFDFSAVDRDFKLRQSIFDGKGKLYRDWILQGALHDYIATKSALTKWLRGWFITHLDLK